MRQSNVRWNIKLIKLNTKKIGSVTDAKWKAMINETVRKWEKEEKLLKERGSFTDNRKENKINDTTIRQKLIIDWKTERNTFRRDTRKERRKC